jgi:hypothetical protein
MTQSELVDFITNKGDYSKEHRQLEPNQAFGETVFYDNPEDAASFEGVGDVHNPRFVVGVCLYDEYVELIGAVTCGDNGAEYENFNDYMQNGESIKDAEKFIVEELEMLDEGSYARLYHVTCECTFDVEEPMIITPSDTYC